MGPDRVTAAAAAPGRPRRPSLADLSPALDADRPHVRLGVLWAVVTVALAVAGPVWLAVWLAAVASVAAAQAARSWRAAPARPIPELALAAPAAMTLAALAGPLALAAASLAVAAAAFGWEPVRAVLGRYRPGSRTSATRTLAVAAPIGLAAASVVLVRGQGLTEALVLLAMAAAYDAAAYVVGVGAPSAWEGAAAGVASVASTSLAVAAVLVPPFRGASPWVLGGAAAALAPLGPYWGAALLGDRAARAPALRRLDSLLFLAPVWAALAALLVS